jgi:hypothetical protein
VTLEMCVQIEGVGCLSSVGFARGRISLRFTSIVMSN